MSSVELADGREGEEVGQEPNHTAAKRPCLLLTINVTVVYTARYVMVLSHAGKIHYEGHWKGWALEIKTSLGPEMA